VVRTPPPGPRPRARRIVAAVKALLFALLAVNTAWFAFAGETSKALDAAAWLVLLALFMIETAHGERLRGRGTRTAVRSLRLAAAIAVLAALVRYVLEANVLDTVNTALWIGVVVLLEAELRFPRAVARARPLYLGAALVLYGGLSILVVLWALRGEWFDAYDAAAWLAAFALLEMDLVQPSAPAISSR
jgi:hypothetical protein